MTQVYHFNWRIVGVLTLVILVILASGCAGVPDFRTEEPSKSQEEGGSNAIELPKEKMKAETFKPREDDTYPAELVNMAVSDLAKQTGQRNEDIEVLRVEPVYWSDSSLGGVAGGNLLVITPGLRIFLKAGGTNYLYHTNMEQVFRSDDEAVEVVEIGSNMVKQPEEKGKPEPFQPRENDAYPAELVEMAVSDLAKELGKREDDIGVLRVEPVYWSDSSLGGVGGGNLPVTTPGFRIFLEAGGTIFLYHTNMEQVFRSDEEVVEVEEEKLGSEGLPVVESEPQLSYPREDETYPRELIQMVLSDLAEYTGQEIGSIEIVQVEPVTWSDASLGGVTDGVLQVLTPGFLITLRVGDISYEYHTSMDQVARAW